MSETKLEAYFFTALLIGVLGVVGLIFAPFVGALALALVLAILGMPLYDHINHALKRPGLSAFIVVALMSGAVLLPATLLLFMLVDEVTGITQMAVHFDIGSLMGRFSVLHARIEELFPVVSSLDLGLLLRSTIQSVGTTFVAMLTSAASAVLELFVSVFALFYFLKDGRTFVHTFVALSPLSDDEDVQIVQKLRLVTRSLIRGTLVIAVLQGVLMGIGCLLFGIPNPVLWGSIAAIAALIPNIGTGIVTVPAVLYLLIVGQSTAAVGMGVWGFGIVGLVDNLLRPYLIGNSVHIHPLFVLLSVLGGIAVFGIAGFLLGPLAFGLLVALSEIYRAKIQVIHTASEIS